jgi:hypothetical protein
MGTRTGTLARFLPALLIVTGCIAKQPDAGTTTSDSTTSPSTAGADPTGINCGADPNSGETLCSGTTACPNNVIDSTNFPSCGFRTVTPSFDLECVCNGNMLCPIGVASTCAAIPALLANRTVADVCNQSGSCQPIGGAVVPTQGTPSTSTCDQSCAADCAGSPLCLEACGC